MARNACILVTFLSSCVLVSILTTKLSGQAKVQNQSADKVRCSALELVDDQGKVRATLSLNEKNRPTCTFFSETGHKLVHLHIDETGPVMALSSPKGEPRLIFAANEMTGHLSIADSEGKPRIGMGVNAQGTASIAFLKRDGARAITITQSEGTHLSAISFNPEGGEKSLFITAKKEGVAALTLRDEQGRVRGNFGLDNEAGGTLRIYDENEKVIWQAGK